MLQNTQDIINEFYTLIGDTSDLSSNEVLKLVNKNYFEILRSKQWEFLKKEATGSVSGTDITQPTDFSNLLTENPKIYVGEKANEFMVIPFNDRRLYTNQNLIAYYDARQKKFVCTKTQDDTYSFDYIYMPEALDLVASTPVFPARFWGVLPFFMASDNDFIQLFEKARSYAAENRLRGEMILSDLKMWNDRITMMQTYGN